MKREDKTSGRSSCPDISSERSICSHQVQHWWHQIGPQILTHISKPALTQRSTWMTSLLVRKYNIAWFPGSLLITLHLLSCEPCWTGHRVGGSGSLSWTDMSLQWLVISKWKVAGDELLSCLAVLKQSRTCLLACSLSWFAKMAHLFLGNLVFHT